MEPVAEKSFTVKMTLVDLGLVADSLRDARVPCEEQDCFTCTNFADIERRIRTAMDQRDSSGS